MRDYRFDRDSSFKSCRKEKRNSNGVFVMDPQIIIEDLEHISTHGRSQARNLLNDTMLLPRLRSDSTVYCLIEHTE